MLRTLSLLSLLLLLAGIGLAAPASAAPCTPEQEQDQFIMATTRYLLVPLPTNGAYWDDGNVQTAGQTPYVEVWATNDDSTGTCVFWVRPYVKQESATPCGPEGRDAELAGQDGLFVPERAEARQDGIHLVGERHDVSVHGDNAAASGRCAPLADVEDAESADERRVYPLP